MKEQNVMIEQLEVSEDGSESTSTYIRIPGEEKEATEQEKIINKFLMDMLNNKSKKLLDNKTVVSVEQIISSWYKFKKEWVENRDA